MTRKFRVEFFGYFVKFFDAFGIRLCSSSRLMGLGTGFVGFLSAETFVNDQKATIYLFYNSAPATKFRIADIDEHRSFALSVEIPHPRFLAKYNVPL